jgi:glycosyltransferase involved in cell wall biosynthesis
MLTEFTFITLTFNHSKYIIEHLESIKSLIEKYGKNISIDMLVADDCSSDTTILLAEKWLNDNRYMFRNINILSSFENKGTIQNLINALEKCQTRFFKFLSGDDAYYDNNIFTIVENTTNILVTPIIPIVENGSSAYIFKSIMNNFYILDYACRKGMTDFIMKYDNFLPAPGVFVPCDSLKNEEYYSFISKYKFIEDIPTWHYLYFIKKIGMDIMYEPFVRYRIGCGISTDKQSKNRNYFNEEKNTIVKDFKLKKYIFPKSVNIYRYMFYFLKKKALKQHNQVYDKYHDISKKSHNY